MKSLIAGVVLIILLGIGGFIYRNVAERTGGPGPTACTADAKLCPDGSGVGRTGPACEFAPCAFPNVEIPEADISFVAPLGYVADENAYGAEPTLIGAFIKPSLSDSVMHTITIRRYPIAAGETADDVILVHTRYQPADMNAEDFSRFDSVLINGKELKSTVIERFEAIVQSTYYLARTEDVLAFTITEHDVVDWMEPGLVIEELPEHQALLELLGTLQLAP